MGVYKITVFYPGGRESTFKDCTFREAMLILDQAKATGSEVSIKRTGSL